VNECTAPMLTAKQPDVSPVPVLHCAPAVAAVVEALPPSPWCLASPVLGMWPVGRVPPLRKQHCCCCCCCCCRGGAVPLPLLLLLVWWCCPCRTEPGVPRHLQHCWHHSWHVWAGRCRGQGGWGRHDNAHRLIGHQWATIACSCCIVERLPRCPTCHELCEVACFELGAASSCQLLVRVLWMVKGVITICVFVWLQTPLMLELGVHPSVSRPK